ncbi:MAG: pyridoxal phosphate-dependent aminotransferase [Candidatus Aminicenantes bacterium]|nr:pyridoxal phosphate-dependent aminotransferase [Candidatus Aminicenantes bacterium]
MIISQRGQTIQASPIRKLKPYADTAKAKGIKIFHLNIGDPDIPAPGPVIETFRNWSQPVLGYGPAQGFLELREAVTRYFAKYDIPLGPDDVLITNGGSEAIHFTFSIVGDVGDEVVIPEPYYTNYNGYAAFAGLKIVPLPLTVENGFRLPSAEAIEARITPRTKAILLCSPNNPTGTVYTPEELDRVVGLVKKHDLFLVGDEVYKEFIYDGLKHKSILEYEDIKDRVVVIDSISKRYSCCGARIGMIITRNKGAYAAALKFAQARLCPPSVEQMAALAAYNMPMDYFVGVRAEYDKRRNILYEGLKDIPGIVIHKPQGAFYVIARLPIKDVEHFAVWLLSEFSLEGQTVMIAPAPGFYSTPSLGTDEARFAYVVNEHDLREAVRVFKAGLEKYQAVQG